MHRNNKLTNEVGAPIANNDHSLTAGPRGPVALQDVWLLEKMAHFDREVIPERRMHAKGWGAYGNLRITDDISCYTKAKVLQPGKVTDLFIRFSTVAGERGAADAERDIRGAAIKFYTEDGNWDFWTLLPESFHQRTITMSDRGIPKSFRHMDMFGEHTFSFYNSCNERFWCKFHFKTQQGLQHLTNAEAAALIANDRESHGRDLFESIERGNFPKWIMYVQIMTEEQARNHYENPFDITKSWRENEFPLIRVGVLQLNRNPENFFAEVEQAAFNPAHVVPGIGFSPDKLLQGRLFSYGDAQRYRLGVNNNHIPVNKARVPVCDNHRDGQMRTDGNYGRTPAYTPNSYNYWSAQPMTMEPPLDLEGCLYRFNPADDPTDDNFRAGGELYRSMSEPEKHRLISNTAENMHPVTKNIKYRHAVHCYLADQEYGRRIAQALNLNFRMVEQLSKLSNDELIQATLSTQM